MRRENVASELEALNCPAFLYQELFPLGRIFHGIGFALLETYQFLGLFRVPKANWSWSHLLHLPYRVSHHSDKQIVKSRVWLIWNGLWLQIGATWAALALQIIKTNLPSVGTDFWGKHRLELLSTNIVKELNFNFVINFYDFEIIHHFIIILIIGKRVLKLHLSLIYQLFDCSFRRFFKVFFQSPNRVSTFAAKIERTKKSFQRNLLNILQTIVQRVCLCQEGLSHRLSELSFLIIGRMHNSNPLVLLKLEGVHDDWTEIGIDLADWYAFW